MKTKIKLVLLLVFITTSMAFAQTTKVKKVTTNRKSPQKVIKKVLPKDHEKVIVKDDTYYFHRGVYYRPEKKGYKVVKAPIGARIRRLPDGFRIVRRTNRIYYVFFHTWYVYDELNDIYIVVEKPADQTDDYQLDKLYLLNGSVLVGIYMGGSRDSIQFLFDNEVKEISVTDIISLEFAAPDF